MLICQGRFTYTHDPCHYPAKYLVIAPSAPKVVCGLHARAYRALVPLKILGPDITIDQIPDVNGFLEEMQRLGVGAIISIEGPTISLTFGGKHGKRAS